MAEVRPAILQRGATELDFQEELKPTQDSLIAKSYYVGGDVANEIKVDGDEITFVDPTNGTVKISDLLSTGAVDNRMVSVKCINGDPNCIVESGLLFNNRQNFLIRGTC